MPPRSRTGVWIGCIRSRVRAFLTPGIRFHPIHAAQLPVLLPQSHHLGKLFRTIGGRATVAANDSLDAPLWEAPGVLNVAQLGILLQRILREFLLHMIQFCDRHFVLCADRSDKEHNWRSLFAREQCSVEMVQLVIGEALLREALARLTNVPRGEPLSSPQCKDIAALFGGQAMGRGLGPEISSVFL